MRTQQCRTGVGHAVGLAGVEGVGRRAYMQPGPHSLNMMEATGKAELKAMVRSKRPASNSCPRVCMRAGGRASEHTCVRVFVHIRRGLEDAGRTIKTRGARYEAA